MTKHLNKAKQTTSRRALSLGAAAAPQLLKGKSKPQQQEASDTGGDKEAVAISSVTMIDTQLSEFASHLSADTLADLDIGIDAAEVKQRNPLDVMFDIQTDWSDSDGNIDEALLANFPAPYSEAPKDMTPAKWIKEKKNAPWPYDKWSERVSQAQGGKRNVNYVWYKESYLKTDSGKAHAAKVKEVQEQIARHGKQPLTGDYQNMELDELQTLERKLTQRITTASNNLRDAVALVRQFAAFAPHSEKIAFSVLTESDAEGNQVPSASRLPIRVATVSVTKVPGGKDITGFVYKKPISIDTFLNYDADKFAANCNIPGKSVYDALLESVPETIGDDKTPTTIKLPLNDERLLSVVGLVATYLGDQSNMSRLIKMLGERDDKNQPKHEAELASFLDLHVATLPIHATFASWYDARNLKGKASNQ
jgi:hypothetical protein